MEKTKGKKGAGTSLPNKGTNTPFAISELKEAIKNMKLNKTAGIDDITAEQIK